MKCPHCGKHIRAEEDPMDKAYKAAARSLKRCLPCPCGGAARWGSGFLYCDECEYETEIGNSVREWNVRAKGTKA